MDTNGAGFIEKNLTAIAIVVGAIIIGGAFLYGGGSAPRAAAPDQGGAVAVDIKQVKTDSGPFIGNANAPVTMAFWYDYQCPFCQQFEQSVTEELNENYVKSGKLKILIKDFQFLGEDSTTAALFGRAVWEAYPDHFYPWFQAVFAAQDDEGDQGFGDLASIVDVTKEKVPAIDTAKIVKLMTDNKAKYEAAIAADRAEGSALGINGTPAVIVGTTLLSGAQPYSAVAALIDAELKK
jgi:protein-disulfide isomerase